MRKQITVLFLLIISVGYGQTAEDLFSANDVKIRWLGIDYSHVVLIGDFSQFQEAGDQNAVELRNEYFPAWNNLILSESDKYDIRGMLRKTDIDNDIAMIMKVNSKAPTEELEGYDSPNYSEEEISKFVSEYPIENTEGIGILFIAESLNKNLEEAYYHFVAMNMKTKEVLLHERLRGEPRGFGLRNYWAGSIYDVINEIDGSHYKNWKRQYR